MALTNFANLTDEQKTIWSMDVWKAARANQFLNQFVGTDHKAMIHRIDELTKSEKGTRAVLTLVADLEGDGVAGDRTLEGNEEALTSYDQVIRVDQLRHANRHEGRMAEQKSVVTFRKESLNVLAHWLADRWDQMGFLTLSGVDYDKTNRGATRVGSDLPNLEFAADVTAPSTNRHFRWDATSGLEAGDTTAVVAADTPTYDMLVEIKARMKENYIRPIRGANGMELYHVFMAPAGFAKLKQDDDFRQALRHAMPRSADNPLFKGLTTGIFIDGLMLHEYHHVFNTKGAVSGTGKWGSGSDVEGQRILVCGAQSLGFADVGSPVWVEKEFDYNNQPGISVGKIAGFKKPVFRSQVTGTDEDFGVVCLDTAI